MTFSRTASYAISALVYLAGQPDGKRSGAQEISSRQGIPISFLEKILQTLRRRGMLRAARGTHGGYEFAVPPQQISLLQVLETFGEAVGPQQCLLSMQGCCHTEPCLLHHLWADLRREFLNRLAGTTVADLAARRAEKGAIE